MLPVVVMKVIIILEHINTITKIITRGFIITSPIHTAIPMNIGTIVDTIIETDIIETNAINTNGITGDPKVTIATRDLTEIVSTGLGTDTIIDRGGQ